MLVKFKVTMYELVDEEIVEGKGTYSGWGKLGSRSFCDTQRSSINAVLRTTTKEIVFHVLMALFSEQSRGWVHPGLFGT